MRKSRCSGRSPYDFQVELDAVDWKILSLLQQDGRMSFSALGVIGIVYALWGWSMTYSSLGWAAADAENPGWEFAKLFANPFDQFGLEGTVPGNYVFVAFQLTR